MTQILATLIAENVNTGREAAGNYLLILMWIIDNRCQQMNMRRQFEAARISRGATDCENGERDGGKDSADFVHINQ